jgi:hypothetical protein
MRIHAALVWAAPQWAAERDRVPSMPFSGMTICTCIDWTKIM